MTKRCFLLSLLLVFCACIGVFGQDARTVEQKIADAVRVYQPDWELQNVLPATRVDSMECDLMSFRWMRDSGKLVDAYLWSYGSEEAATAGRQEIIQGYNGPTDKEMREAAGKRADGQGYTWAKEYAHGVSLSFSLMKKGKTVVLIVGGTPEEVTGFLSLIASQVPATRHQV